MCMGCNKSKAIVNGSGKGIKHTASKNIQKSNAGRRMTFGSPFGSPKVKMSFASRNR